MPRERKFPDGSPKATALVWGELYTSVLEETPRVKKGFTMAEAVNDGLTLWMAYRKGDRHLQRQLEEILNEWRPKYQKETKTTPKGRGNSATG